MKVLVIGAAGKSGGALVNEALAAGHKVTAFVRDAAQYTKANVRVVTGDVLDPAAVDVAVAGQDAVIDALGGKTPWKVTTMETKAAHNIVDAMRRNGVGRLLKISVVGVGESVKRRLFQRAPAHADVSAGSAGRQGGHGGRDRRQQLGLDACTAADVDRPREDRDCQSAEYRGWREGAQNWAGRSGCLHGAATGKRPVCASGSDSDDHISNMSARINLSHRSDLIGPLGPVTTRQITVESHDT